MNAEVEKVRSIWERFAYCKSVPVEELLVYGLPPLFRLDEECRRRFMEIADPNRLKELEEELKPLLG